MAASPAINHKWSPAPPPHDPPPAQSTQKGSGGINLQPFGRNHLATPDTPAILVFVQPAQCLLDALQLARAGAFIGLRHGLTLHRIHARQPPDRLLVEFYRIAVLGGE
jgi:hypothetical protein